MWSISFLCSQDEPSNGLKLSGIKIIHSTAPSKTSSHISRRFLVRPATMFQFYHLCQGRSTVVDCTIQFRILAAASGWNKVALITGITGPNNKGFFPNLRLQLAVYDDTLGFFQRSIRVSQRISACQLENIRQPFSPDVPLTTPTTPAIEPMLVDSFHLCSISIPALIDSDSAGDFISKELLGHLKIKKLPCSQTLNIYSILGKPLGRGVITHCTPILMLNRRHHSGMTMATNTLTYH